MVTGVRDRDEPLEAAPGTSAILTDEGWETADYVEPGDDWDLLEDGSYASPDGRTRTWLASAPRE